MKRAMQIAGVLACSGALGCSSGFGCSALRTAQHDGVVDPLPLGGRFAHVDGMLAPLPEERSSPDRRQRLGERLFHDPRLSEDERVACATCHNLAMGGANALSRSALPGRNPVPVNVPTVFNLAYDFRYSWSGRFVDIGTQIDFALGLKDAMGTSWESASRRLRTDPSYVTEFERAYPDGLSAANLRHALIVYNLSLSTPGARFDRFLRGELELSEQEARGYTMFREYGCVSCHQGVNIGGNMFQRFGVMRDYFAERGNVEQADLGLYNATRREEDRHVFRVPSLRNVALTAPYFHDGSARTLLGAVQTMARYQLGRELSQLQAVDIVAFLTTLTGDIPAATR
jgi:cytochrome c peroxidase